MASKPSLSHQQKAAEHSRPRFDRAEDEIAVVPSMPDVRFWADSETAFAQAVSPRGPWLLLSGGGADGAFGAGLLSGLTESGKRPDYAVITGVSSGAMIASLAFAGPTHDQELRNNFAGITAADIFEVGETGESLLDTWPLRELIARRITPQLLAEIAAEHRRGRRLFVLTSNLDAERPVTWNMGAIAAHGDDRALKLFRDVLLSSASIPGLFPPVLIDVEADGHRFQELHNDGSVGAPLFVGPETLLSEPSGTPLPATSITVVVNGKLTPDFSVTERSILSIVSRSISMGLKMATRAIIGRIHDTARRQGVDFNLAYIDASFNMPSRGAFDPDYMRALFERGLLQGKSATPFRDVLPASPQPDETVGAAR